MSETLSALPAPMDARLGGVLLANMLAAWLDGNPEVLSTAETADEPENYRASPEQTGLRLSTTVNAGAGTPSSGEHGTSVCSPSEGGGTGLERVSDPHAGPGLGKDGDRDDCLRGLQDPGGRCFDGPGGRGFCIGSFTAGPLESGLASTAGTVCAHLHAGDRRRRLLRSSGFQRRPSARLERDYGPSGITFFERAPPGRACQSITGMRGQACVISTARKGRDASATGMLEAESSGSRLRRGKGEPDVMSKQPRSALRWPGILQQMINVALEVVSSWARVWPAQCPPSPTGARRTLPAIAGRSVADSRPRPTP